MSGGTGEKKRLGYTGLDSRPTNGVEVVSLTFGPPFTLRKFPGTLFCKRLSRPRGYSAAGRIRSLEKAIDLIGNGTRSRPACRTVPQPITIQDSAHTVQTSVGVRRLRRL
jgi:hypothetical protein